MERAIWEYPCVYAMTEWAIYLYPISTSVGNQRSKWLQTVVKKYISRLQLKHKC